MDTLTPQPKPRSKAPRIKPGYRSSLRQVIDLQQVAYLCGMRLADDCLKPDISVDARAKSATAMSNVIRSWEATEDRKRIIRGKPLPGSLRPEQPKKKRSSVAFVPPEE